MARPKTPTTTEFEGEIVVSSRIIDYLSSGLYESPAACLKELVNNSYDADANNVRIYVKPDADQIIIDDDGHGMTRGDFERHFKRIAESHKRDKSETTDSGRPKIGRIGIGVIAANELCEVLEIFSTKENSKELLHVKINFSEMNKPLADRRRDGEDGDIAKADYVGVVSETEASDHYTRIFLDKVRGEARNILAGAGPQRLDGPRRSLYGYSHESVAKILKELDLPTWKEFDSYSETMLKVALNVPVEYAENWLPKKMMRQVVKFTEPLKNSSFKVYYDGTELRKPIIFNPSGRSFIKTFNFKGKNVSARGYFFAQHGGIKPNELHGMLVRIRHAAVGQFDNSFWEFPISESSLIQRWVSGEIWASDKLEAAMNIDGRTLRETHPAYVELREALHNELREVFRSARSRIYQAGNFERRRERVEREVAAVRRTAEEYAPVIGRRETRKLIEPWVEAVRSDPVDRAVLKKYTVSEFYNVVLDVAKDILSKKQLVEFLTRLNEKLLSKRR